MITVIDLQFLGVSKNTGAFLLDAGKKEYALIETGPFSTFPMLEKTLNAKGIDAKQIKHVFLTHIHFDHAGAAWWFADNGATIYVHPVGAKHLADPSKLTQSARMIYKDQMDVLWGEMRSINPAQIRIPEHGEKFTIGEKTLTAWYTPGHAVHHIAWQIGDELVAGDVAGVKIAGGLVVPPCPPPDINLEDWHASIALLKGLNLKKIYISHFGAVTNVNQHLSDLEKTLAAWGAWMFPHAIRKSTVEEITPRFEAYIEQQLIEMGVSASVRKKYETANPSWMSVMGLMRYWTKKLKG
jgi:glyoxylase-like metal-dependent hydrolase (beta-lactamase superfamily II)